jgi:hypothetical protein
MTYTLEEATQQWAKAIIRVPKEMANACMLNRKAFQEMIGETPEEYLNRNK